MEKNHRKTCLLLPHRPLPRVSTRRHTGNTAPLSNPTGPGGANEETTKACVRKMLKSGKEASIAACPSRPCADQVHVMAGEAGSFSSRTLASGRAGRKTLTPKDLSLR